MAKEAEVKELTEKLKYSEEIVLEQSSKIEAQEKQLAALKATLEKSKGKKVKTSLPEPFEFDKKVYQFKSNKFNFVKENGKVVQMTASDALKDKAVIKRLVEINFSGLVEVSK